MSDHKLAFIFFEIGMIFCVVAMILGPVGVEIWSVACSVVAIILACMGIYLAFCSWNEVPPVRKKTAPGGGESLPNQGESEESAQMETVEPLHMPLEVDSFSADTSMEHPEAENK